jgi:hypothetical protein
MREQLIDKYGLREQYELLLNLNTTIDPVWYKDYVWFLLIIK